MRMTLIGRPGKTEARKELVLMTFVYTPPSDLDMLPGVPAPPQEPIPFVAYVSSKQWYRIEEILSKDPDEQLVLDGNCDYDAELKHMALYAMHASTVTLEREKAEKLERERLAQKARAEKAKQKAEAAENTRTAGKAGSEQGGKKVKPTAKTTATPAPTRHTPPPVTPKVPTTSNKQAPEGAAPADAQKLASLYAAAELYRQKISAIETKPANQRFGLEMMQKLLKTTEDEIATIEKKYNSA